MNIFVLDENPALAAQYHCDMHIVKMILESAQMLSTAVGAGYKATHHNHPCTRWVSESRQNAMWLITLADSLNFEYKRRYNKIDDHKSRTVIEQIEHLVYLLPDRGLTRFAQAMPDEFKSQDPVVAYRSYYLSKPFVDWQKTNRPYWA